MTFSHWPDTYFWFRNRYNQSSPRNLLFQGVRIHPSQQMDCWMLFNRHLLGTTKPRCSPWRLTAGVPAFFFPWTHPPKIKYPVSGFFNQIPISHLSRDCPLFCERSLTLLDWVVQWLAERGVIWKIGLNQLKLGSNIGGRSISHSQNEGRWRKPRQV